ncbi:MAG TPA: hypothetical protein VKC17_07565 [Sphingomicrobium sp.]|nr:hypothetical protein [Sphingomicrobium sp.]
MTPALAETLALVAEAASGAADDWWIIGSAAVVLHGRSVPHIKDVDLLMSAADAAVFLKRTGGPVRAGQADERFRSLVFGLWTVPPIPVEVMGGFSVAADGGWRDVMLTTREPVSVADACVYVPAAEELVRLLHSFGRAKDLERARLMGR